MNTTRSSGDLCLLSWEMPDLVTIEEKYSGSVQYASFVLSVIICVAGLIGNVVVLGVTGFIMKKRQSRIWFLNLAVADLVFLLCLPLITVSEFQNNWTFGSSLCKICNYLSIINMYSSIFFITALNIDRALAIAKPIWHHKSFSPKARRRICAAIWSVTVLSSIPALFLGGEVETKGKTECSLFNIGKVNLDTSAFAPKYLDMGAINTFSGYVEQCKTYHCCADENALRLWNQMVYTAKCLIIPLLVIGYFIPICVTLCSNIIIVLHVKKSREVKLSRLYRITVAVVLTHLLTWTPVVIAEIILLVAVQTMNVTLMYKIIVFLPLLSCICHAHICLNPFMYVLVGSQVRSGITEFVSRVRSSLSYAS